MARPSGLNSMEQSALSALLELPLASPSQSTQASSASSHESMQTRAWSPSGSVASADPFGAGTVCVAELGACGSDSDVEMSGSESQALAATPPPAKRTRRAALAGTTKPIAKAPPKSTANNNGKSAGTSSSALQLNGQSKHSNAQPTSKTPSRSKSTPSKRQSGARKFKGVTFDASMCAFRTKVSGIHVGYFDDVEQAARAFDDFKRELARHSGSEVDPSALNFPLEDSAALVAAGELQAATGGAQAFTYASRRGGTPRGTSKYRGVLFDKASGKWRAKIKKHGSSTYLGLFTEEKPAAKAYDRAAFAMHGSRAKLNFPAAHEAFSASIAALQTRVASGGKSSGGVQPGGKRRRRSGTQRGGSPQLDKTSASSGSSGNNSPSSSSSSSSPPSVHSQVYIDVLNGIESKLARTRNRSAGN